MRTQQSSSVFHPQPPENGAFETTHTQIADYLPEHLDRAGLIDRYRKFVEQVEHGYKLGLVDYRNDLDLLGILASSITKSKTSTAASKPTSPTAPSASQETSPGDPPWDFGYPPTRERSSSTILETKA